MDWAALLNDTFGSMDNPNSSFLFGQVDINLGPVSTDPPVPTDAFLSDGFHPGTVVQGVLANMFIEATNRAYGAGLTPLSDQEILELAGIEVPTPPGVVTYFDVSPYVIVPEPLTLLVLAIGGVTLLRRSR
jgi:hypothetical protein